ncbi:MAG: helix-turn-helix transcriptional regulator [Candidatus Margulisbacteria bacterium]|nr:helix-turn-helix transcriptional regulator [Candidatus Margulisiibacteriota bacterium]
MASKIGNVLREIRESKGLKMNEVSKKAELAFSSIRSIELGIISNPSIDAISAIAKVLDVPLSDVIAKAGYEEVKTDISDPDYIRIKYFKTYSDLSHYLTDKSNFDSYEILKVKESLLKHPHLQYNNVYGVTINGNAMSPIINDEDVVLINTEESTIRDGHVYCFRLGEELFIRYLYRQPDGSLLAGTESGRHEAFVVNPNQKETSSFSVIGEVFCLYLRVF